MAAGLSIDSAFDFDAVQNRRGSHCVKWDTVPDDVIPMSIADMDFASPPCVVEALTARVSSGVYGYTFPPKSLTRTLLAWLDSQYGARADADWIVPLGGIVPALAVAAHLTEGTLAAHTPNYSMLLGAPARAGRAADLTTFPLANNGESYAIDFNALERDAPSGTGLYYLCNPHNPVGRVYDKVELERLCHIADERGWIVVSDEIHCELLFDKTHTPYWTLNDAARDHSVTFYSPGKTYNLPGIPFAFAVIPNPTLRKRFVKLNYGGGMPGIFNVTAAEAAYRDGAQWRDARLAVLRGNRDELLRRLAVDLPLARFTRPEATYLEWIDFRPYGLENPAAFILEKARVALTDGKSFGGQGYARLNFGCPRALLDQALDRIRGAFL
ncbi:MAG: aminotransferase class I/II-fold pyridoxal phosphate-dependent enzyme [Oscillospiraceae bacterium]|nr:aminotransferase class I/II-fold pyridoxal phosphate-dependent enzyme [Oscillospiraceae bacterium]